MAIQADWRDDYEVAEGFRLDVDADNFRFPTSIAVVPNPGESPDSPLYYVTEIRGRVRVVTKNRSVHTFAEIFFDLEPMAELPNEAGGISMAGLCLEPNNGYVFVSYAYQDELGYYRNGLSRFQSEPGVFCNPRITSSLIVTPCSAAVIFAFLNISSGISMLVLIYTYINMLIRLSSTEIAIVLTRILLLRNDLSRQGCFNSVSIV